MKLKYRSTSVAAIFLTLGTTGILFLDSAQAQTTQTWDGEAGDNSLNSLNNWSGNALPVSGDTARWNGTVAGNLVLDYTTAFVNTTNGVSLDITSAQTGSLTIGTSNGSSIAVQNITIASGAGAFTYGDGTGPESFGFRGPSHTFTNNSSNTATFASGISFFTGGGSNRTVTFAGTGNWAVNSALSTTTGLIAITKQDAGTLTLSGANAYRGITTISGGTLSVSSIANGGVTGPTVTTTSGATTATVSSTAGLTIGQTVVSQRITNGTTITGINAGTNTITLSIAASGTGTNVSSTIGTANGLGISTNAATNLVFDGGTLQYTGNTAISDRAFTINASKTATIDVTTANQSLTLASAADATTDGALNKTGAGTLTFSGINTYTGPTTISGGTLLINGSSSAASAVAVNTGALGGTGSVLGPVTVAATGSLAPGLTTGITTGTLTVASADLSAGGRLAIEINDAATPVSDQLAVTGTLNVTGAKLAINATATPAAPSYLIASATAITGTIAPGDITGLPAGYTVQQTATSITLVAHTYANWLSINSPATGFITDSDNDGVPNGLENVLGTNPNASSAGLTEVYATASTATFKHTLNPNIASDVTYTYEWSTDLSEWKASGATNTGDTTATITPSTPVSGVITVTTAITSGPATKLFTRIKASQP